MEVTLTSPTPGTQTIYSQSAVNNKRLRIDIGNGRQLDIEFFRPNDTAPIEVAVCIENSNGSYQDIAVVRQGSNYMELFAYTDSESEDYTHKFVINYAKDIEEENT